MASVWVMRAFNVHPRRELLMSAFPVAGTRTWRPSCSSSSPSARIVCDVSPTKVHDVEYYQGTARGGGGGALGSLRTQLDRPSLDDVERLSRGEASKAKIGSRAVPHRLNADERTAYELAKKRGYLVRQFRTRQYPVSNTYRNYCDAIGWPNLRIDQGPAGSLDTLVVDLTTLRLEEADLMALQREILQAINSGSDEPKEENVLGKLNEVITDATTKELEDSQSSILHFHFIRSDAKRLTQVVQGCCKMYAAASIRKMGS